MTIQLPRTELLSARAALLASLLRTKAPAMIHCATGGNLKVFFAHSLILTALFTAVPRAATLAGGKHGAALGDLLRGGQVGRQRVIVRAAAGESAALRPYLRFGAGVTVVVID